MADTQARDMAALVADLRERSKAEYWIQDGTGRVHPDALRMREAADALASLQIERDAALVHARTMETSVLDVEEREAKCCPEDVAFDEYIRALQGKLSRAEAERDAAQAKAAAEDLKRALSYTAEDVERCAKALDKVDTGCYECNSEWPKDRLLYAHAVLEARGMREREGGGK